MQVAPGADPAGFALKQAVAEQLRRAGHAVSDLDAYIEERSDYTDFAR
jgi:ribose 5-phosphate isomerase RpiB